jgi:hypothetical protein
MTDRVRILDSVTGAVLHEGPRPRVAPAPPMLFFGRRVWEFGAWLAEIEKWERIAGPAPVTYVMDLISAVHAIDLDMSSGVNAMTGERTKPHPLFGPIGDVMGAAWQERAHAIAETAPSGLPVFNDAHLIASRYLSQRYRMDV